MTPADYSYFVLFAVVAGGFCFVNLAVVSWILRPFRPYKAKLSTYECGEEVKGKAHVQFRVGYYIFALIFVVFDVEAVFFYPWAVVLRQASRHTEITQIIANPGLFAYCEMLVFLGILGVGLLYAWRKAALTWH